MQERKEGGEESVPNGGEVLLDEVSPNSRVALACCIATVILSESGDSVRIDVH
jgi:hypothetical protein